MKCSIMLHFIRAYIVCRVEKRSSDKIIQYILENYNLTPLDMYNGLSQVYVSNQKEESNSIQRVSVSAYIFSSPEPKAQDELIVLDSSRRPCVRPFTISNMNISETSQPIIIKFHQEHHWGWGLTALGFG